VSSVDQIFSQTVAYINKELWSLNAILRFKFRAKSVFFTEKTAKPIIARRLFVMFAGQGYLARLQQLGFRTFDSIIDESYDQESDPVRRWGMACDQLLLLTQKPQDQVLTQIKPIVDHNFKVMMNSNWYTDFSSDLENLLGTLAEQTRR
jgi:hypothetical protein